MGDLENKLCPLISYDKRHYGGNASCGGLGNGSPSSFLSPPSQYRARKSSHCSNVGKRCCFRGNGEVTSSQQVHHSTASFDVPSVKLLNQTKGSLVLRATPSLRRHVNKPGVLAKGMVMRMEWAQGIDICPRINLGGEGYVLKFSICVSASAEWRSSALKTITVTI